MSAVRGYDNLYNESVNDIALMNYNKGIANRLRIQEQQMQANLPFKEPKLLSGGVRASNMIQPGTSVDAVPRVVGGRAFRTFTGNELPSQGGVNRMKKATRWTKYAKDTVGDAFDIAKMAGMGGKVNRMKKATRWTNYAKDTAKDALDIAKMAGMGGKVNRLKKATKWTDYAKNTVGDAFDIAKMAGMGGKVNRMKKATKWTDYAKNTVGDAFDIAKMAGMGNKLVYSPELQKALGGCGDCSGGVKKPRKTRFVKGSPEAKAWGEKMKQARMKTK
jgi:hypothetical protein